MALTIIAQSIDDETLLRVAEKETASYVWVALCSMYVGDEHVREARIQTLQFDFDKLKMIDSESVDDFVVKFTTLVRRIREFCDAMDEKYVMNKLWAISTKFINVASSFMF